MQIHSDGFGGEMGHIITSNTVTMYEGFAPSSGMSHGERANTLHVGGNDIPHNNMQPYSAVYIFKRTA